MKDDKKYEKYWTRGKRRSIILTEYGEKYLRTRFKNTHNDELMNTMGLSFSVLHRFARAFGLKKTAQFVKKCQRNACDAASRAWKQLPESEKKQRTEKMLLNLEPFREHWSKELRRKSMKQRLGKRRWAEIMQKGNAKRNESIASDRRRILFGLPQRTKMKLVSAPKEKICARNRMRRVYLWSCQRGSADFYLTDSTVRNKSLEEKYTKMYGFCFHTPDSNQNANNKQVDESLEHIIASQYVDY